MHGYCCDDMMCRPASDMHHLCTPSCRLQHAGKITASTDMGGKGGGEVGGSSSDELEYSIKVAPSTGMTMQLEAPVVQFNVFNAQ